MDDTQLRHLGPADIHDGSVIDVDHKGDEALVTVQGASGELYRIAFSGVQSVIANRAVGMTLYAFSELAAEGSGRRFTFTNWDDEDDAKLDIIAQNFSIDHGTAA